MTIKKCYLIVPGDSQSIRLASLDQKETYFTAGELEALKISNLAPPLVGGNYHVFQEGVLEQDGDFLIFTTEDIISLDSATKIIFGPSSVISVNVTWIDT